MSIQGEFNMGPRRWLFSLVFMKTYDKVNNICSKKQLRKISTHLDFKKTIYLAHTHFKLEI